jgi:hypothetical protein
VREFLEKIEDPKKRDDAFELVKLMEEVTGLSPKMWGGSIIGFGSYHYKYASGTEGDSLVAGFSPRKDNFALYLTGIDHEDALMEKLGKYKTGKSCVYVKKMADVDADTLKALVQHSIDYVKETYPTA